jgi:hypothetical protein
MRRRTVVTHGRESVRESLRVFSRVTRHLAATQAPSVAVRGSANAAAAARATFEGLCAATGVPGAARLAQPSSCGNTMECFASLFVPPGSLQMSQLLDGGGLWQLWHNPNVVIYSWHVHVVARARRFLGWTQASLGARTRLSRWAQCIGRRSSSLALDRLERALLQVGGALSPV